MNQLKIVYDYNVVADDSHDPPVDGEDDNLFHSVAAAAAIYDYFGFCIYDLICKTVDSSNYYQLALHYRYEAVAKSNFRLCTLQVVVFLVFAAAAAVDVYRCAHDKNLIANRN